MHFQEIAMRPSNSDEQRKILLNFPTLTGPASHLPGGSRSLSRRKSRLFMRDQEEQDLWGVRFRTHGIAIMGSLKSSEWLGSVGGIQVFVGTILC